MCEDCVFSRENGCAALTVKQCMLGKTCSFYKTEHALKVGRAKAEARIAQLSEAEKEIINHKYRGYKPKQVLL